MNDWQLLQEYAARGSEAAFRSLTDRHLNLVYSAALRQVNDPQLAEEVCQTVFLLLARKASSLGQGVVLAGWLFRTTRFVAARARRGEQRRQRREQEAFAMQQPTAPDQAWPRLAPTLDEALAHLGETDRHALLLRFFEDKSLKETGAALGVNEDAARKRVGRAVEKLRGFFAGRGFKVSAGVLGAALATYSVQAAPPSLAGNVASMACAGAGAAPAALPSLAREVLGAWRWARLKLAGSLAVGCAGVVALLIAFSPHKPVASVLASDLTEPPPAPAVATTGAAQPNPLVPTRRTPHAPRATNQLLRLHVVAKDNLEPARNAQLALNTVVDGVWRQSYDLVTDATGTAEISYPPGITRLDVGVLSWGWGARSAMWVPARQDLIPSEYTLQVERVTNTMGGWLRDAKNRPVADAEITVAFLGTGDASTVERPREQFGFTGVGHPVVARSDRQGWWTCAIIVAASHGEFSLTARHPACQPTTIVNAPPSTAPDAAQNHKLQQLWAGKLVTRMNPALAVVGRVLDAAGYPVPKAMVAHEPYGTDALVVPTDAIGQFAFTNLEAGDFDFTVTAPGFAPEYREVSIEADMEPAEIRLQPGALLRLRLADEQGEAVVGAKVVLEQWGDHRLKLKWMPESGADGRIEWNSAPPKSELVLAALKEGWCYSRDLKFLADGEEHLVTMQRALGVSGHVTDAATGQPITSFKAFPGYGNGDDAWERLDTRQGTKGDFSVRFEEQRTPWRVRVEAEGYAPFVSESLATNATGLLNVALRRSDSSR